MAPSLSTDFNDSAPTGLRGLWHGLARPAS